MRVDKRPLAERDLQEIWRYTADEWGEEQADRYLRGIDAAISQVSRRPELGNDFAHVRRGMRRLTVERHRVFYLIEGGSMVVLRVLHYRMDADRHIAADDEY